ncbi:hypothetical protein WN51_06976 [Melipona quadrifasciata]|uniref:Uncharacterized protein n=1 Tax=Melipona quadrifasciata TaxID=166423 RepID=A0A0M8ZSP9_9HYME|nr:hypothetical protein WN51_06976 [Melipona quadrifasciata]
MPLLIRRKKQVKSTFAKILIGYSFQSQIRAPFTKSSSRRKITKLPLDESFVKIEVLSATIVAALRELFLLEAFLRAFAGIECFEV